MLDTRYLQSAAEPGVHNPHESKTQEARRAACWHSRWTWASRDGGGGVAASGIIALKHIYDISCLCSVQGAPQKKPKKTRESRSVVFARDCVFLAYFVKTCCTSF
jgi:hypothetical protein